MRFILPKKELIFRTSVSDPYDFYYMPIPPIRKIFIDRIGVTISMLERKKYGKILEIGVGAGISLPTLAQIADKIYGVDVHEHMDKLDRLINYYKIKDKVVLKKVDAEKMPFKAGTFDAIVGVSVLEHLPHPEKAMKELTRVLKKDGEAVFGFPTESIINRMIFPILTLIGEHEKGEHKQHAQEIVPMLRKYFYVEKIKHLPSFLPEGLVLYTMVKCRKK